MKKNKLLSVLFSVLLVFMSVNTISASTYNDFTIQAVIPENQRDKTVGYFDLNVDTNTKQTLEIEVINNGNETMEAEILFVDGSTGINATKIFNQKSDADESMIPTVTEMVTLRENKIEVAPKSSAIVHLDVDVAGNEFDGVRMGGITVVATDMKENQKSSGNGISFDNQIAYTLALQMRMNDNLVTPNLNYKESRFETVDLQPKFISNIQNDQPMLMNNVSVKGNVKDSKTNKVVATVDRSNGGILPTTNFDVVYTLTDGEIESGMYLIDLTIENEDGSWHWEESIEVNADQIDKTNEEKVDFRTKKKSPWLLIIMGVLLLVILWLLFISWKRRKDEKEESKK